MLDNEKIRVMTNLAIYEKNVGKDDKDKMEYFRTDYVSKNNFKIQVAVTVALLFILGFNFGMSVYANLATITDFDFVGLGARYLFIWVAFMVVYTIVSTIYNRALYSRAEKRINKYSKLLKKLNKY